MKTNRKPQSLVIATMAAMILGACAHAGSTVPVYGQASGARENANQSPESGGIVEVASANDPDGEHVQPGDRNR